MGELTGRVLGEFVLREPIGEGGFGRVFRAEQPALGREVVVKILHERLAGHRQATARFMGEARLASQLEHPYAAHVYACGAESDGLLWIAMELVRGTPLSKLLKARGKVSLDELVPFVENLCEVVHTAHELGVVHRDIKPANVMVMTRAGRWLPKLLDFGIARSALVAESNVAALIAPDADPDSTAPLGEDRITEAGAMLGSPSYMAPEQWLAPASVDGRADVYALGVLTYEALVGRVPFQAATLAAIFALHHEAPVPPLGAGFPAALDAVIGKAMAKRPEDRYATPLELATALRAATGVEARDPLPVLDEQLRDQLLRDAPRPLAEAVAILAEADSPHQILAASGQVMSIALRFVALIALAARDRRAEPLSRDRLAMLRTGTMPDAEWLALACDLLRPHAGEPELFAIPELPRLIFERDGSETAWRRAAEAFVDDPFASLAATSPQAVARVAAMTRVAQLASVLRGLELFGGYRLAVPPEEGEPMSFSGLRGGPRIAVERPLAGPAIVDGFGRVVVDLGGVARFAAPTPGAAMELFLLEGHGRHGARLVAWPSRFELHDTQVWRELGIELSRDEAAIEGVAYPGLRPFTASEASRFFGREREAEAFRNRLLVEPVLAVVGPSGSGKSSFVQAGVIAELRDGWHAITVRPGPDPLGAIGEVDDEKLVVVIDQFEELFTQCRDQEVRIRFADRLARIAKHPGQRLIIVLRDDFLVRATELDRSFTRSLQILGTPVRDELARILVAPATQAGYRFEDDELVDEIVDAVAGTDGGLALLAFTAARLWERRDPDAKLLTREAYSQLGGVGGALAKHADETLAGLSVSQRALAREAFRRLVTSEGTRADFGRDELVGALGGSDDARTVVERLVDKRLLLTLERDDGAHVEIVHEVLVRAWPQLVAWRSEDAEGTRMLGQLRAAARQWDERGRASGLLWRADPWTELAAWHARHPRAPMSAIEHAFVAACRREAQQRRRVVRGIAFASAVVAIGVIGALWLANRRVSTSAAEARGKLINAWREHGRKELLEDRAASALPWLVAVADEGHHDPALHFMIGRAVDALSHRGPVLAGHRQQVRAVAFAGTAQVVTASDDGRAILWDAATAKQLHVLEHGGRVAAVAVTRDGAWIATAGADRVKLWSARDGKLAWESVLERAVDVKFVDGDRKLAMFSESYVLTLRELASTGETRIVAMSPWQHLPVSADGRRFAAVIDNQLALLDTAGQTLAAGPLAGEVSYLEVDATGKHIAVAYADHTVTLYDEAARPLRTLAGHTDLVRSIQFSPDGHRLLTTSVDRTAKVWDLATGTIVFSLAEDDRVTRGLYSPDGTLLLTISGDSTPRLYDARDGTRLVALDGHATTVSSAAFSPSGNQVLTGSLDATARLWDITRLPIATSFAPRDRRNIRMWSARIAPDGTRIVTADQFGIVQLWDATTGALVRAFDTPRTETYAAAFSPTGDRIVTAAYDRTARTYRVSDGAPLSVMTGHTAHVWTAEFSADGTKVVTASWDHTAAIWDAKTGARLHVLAGHSDIVWQAGFSSDGSLVATASDDGTAKLWDAHTGREVATLAGHRAGIGTVAFSADGRRLVTGSRDLTARVWDVATRRTLATLSGHTNAINVAYFSPDGAFVVTAGYDGRSRVFDAESGALLAIIDSNHTPANSAEPSRDGRFILTVGSYDDRVKLWRLDLRHAPPDRELLRSLLDCRYRDCAAMPALDSKR